ncbi:MAG: DNA primase [Faecalibacterium sp.]|jgi:DNA primase|nr:DNA primase [Faecalibacterium sp.]
MIPQDYIDEVVRRNDITDVVGSYVQLKRKGRLYGGLCPFHSEKTPSFYVYPDTQSFYCFGCGAGGDVITFIKKINNLDYVEAVKLLAGRAGMPEPAEDDKVGRMRSRVLSINRDAARYFHACLNSSTEEAKIARAYWRRRGLEDKTIVRFGLGYAPDDFHGLRDYLRDKGYSDMEVLESGLCKRSEKGNIYNIFRHRVMTPIFDLRGNIIAFGGRVLDDSKPKYINSPETLVYKKSKTVFALQIAKKSVSKRFVLCEGYMDVISMQQAGIDTAVCACGTALTPEQVKLIGEYADEVILSYDSDEAGQKATARSLGMFGESPVKVSVLQIPGAKDPDEYIKKYGAERFEALLDGTGNAIEFRIGQIRKKYDLTQDKGRLDYISDVLGLLAQRVSPTEREVYAGRLAEETNISKNAILEQLESAVKRSDYRRRKQQQQELLHSGTADQIKVPYQAGGQKALGVAAAEEMLAMAMLRNPAYIAAVMPRLPVENIVMPDMKEAIGAMYRCEAAHTPVTLAALSTLVGEKTLTELSRLVAQYHDVNPTEQDVALYLDRIAQSAPKSSAASQMSNEQIEQYLQTLRDRKAGGADHQDEDD